MKLGFLGTGHMGGTIVRALDRSFPPDVHEYLLSNPTVPKAEAVARTLKSPVQVVSNEEAAKAADLLFLGMKPGQIGDALAALRPVFEARVREGRPPVLVSMAAAVEIETILQAAGFELPVIRIMPNTPIACDEGVVAYDLKNVSAEAEAAFTALFEKCAIVLKTTEQGLDAVGTLSGSGPAFVYLFANALAKAGEALGLSTADALQLSLRTVKGAATLAEESGKDPETLAREVATPGGTTVEGVKVLKDGNLDELIQNTLAASFRRTQELKSK